MRASVSIEDELFRRVNEGRASYQTAGTLTTSQLTADRRLDPASRLCAGPYGNADYFHSRLLATPG